jgi:hypothetical protein
MIGRFSTGKQVGTPSMSKKTGKPVKAQTPGMYPKAEADLEAAKAALIAAVKA